MSTARDWSVYPVWVLSEPRFEYAKIRAGRRGLVVGAPVQVQRDGESTWSEARIIDQPEHRDGHGHMVWIELVLP